MNLAIKADRRNGDINCLTVNKYLSECHGPGPALCRGCMEAIMVGVQVFHVGRGRGTIPSPRSRNTQRAKEQFRKGKIMTLHANIKEIHVKDFIHPLINEGTTDVLRPVERY